MIGIRELASLLASAIVLFGSVLVPVGEQGTVAVESLGGDATRAFAEEPVPVQLAETEVHDLVTSRGAPTPPASLEGGFETIRFATAPGAATTVGLADREIPAPAGSSVRVEGFSGTIGVDDATPGVTVELSGTATSVEVQPPQAPAVETSTGPRSAIPATNVTLGGDLVSGSIEQGGSFEDLSFTVDPGENLTSATPRLDVDNEVLPFEQTVRVRVSDYVGLIVVAEVDREGVWLQLDGFGNVSVLGEDYERHIHHEAEISADDPNQDPSANFTFDPGQPQAEETVHFQSRSEDDIAIRSWDWDFGDGATSQAQHPEHTYSASGTYEVSLTVTDAAGRTDTETETLTVVNSRPVVSLEQDPEEVTQGEPVELTANASDRDGEVQTYNWTIPGRDNPRGRTVNHTFVEEGLYEVSVVATDDEGAQAEASEELQVHNAPPEANFTLDPENPMARQTAFLESTATDYGDGEVVNHTWEIETVGLREGEVVKLEFPQDGEHEITLQARDDDGATDSITRTVEIRNAPPDADIRVGPEPLNPQTQIEFTADVTDDDPIAEAEWIFSDGVTENGLSVTRSFPEGGAFEVTLHLEDADGAQATFDESFYVNKAPDLALGPLGHPPADEIAVETSELFTVSARVDDPDSEDVSLSWSVNGLTPGQLSQCTHAPDGNTSRMQCGWPDDGEHRINVHARDGEGATTREHISVLVLNQAPTLNPSLLTDVVNVGELVQLRANVDDVDGKVEEIVWRIDGTSAGVGHGIQHTFQQPGTHDVTVNATDDDGAIGSTTFTVDVNAKPEVDITFSPDQPVAGEAVSFHADAHDPDGDDGALAYEWRFDDGTNASGPDPTHTFEFGGSYFVELSVTDEAGATIVRQQQIEVDTPPLGADLSVSPSPPRAGQSTTFTVDVEDDREIEGIEWTFGDGASETTGEGVSSTSHTYEDPETFTLTVEIDADHGEQRRLNAQIRVTGSESYQVLFEPRLPDGQCLDVDDGKVDVQARNLQTGTTIGLDSGVEDWQTSSPCTLRYSFPAGTWSIGDQLDVQVHAGPAERTETYELGSERPLEDRNLRLLQAPIELVGVDIFSPTQESQSDEDETYVSPTEPVFVTGQARWVDGTLADGLPVSFTVTYRTPTEQVGLGATYHQASFETPSDGVFEREVPAPVLGASPSTYTAETGPSVAYLPGQYRVSLGVESGVYTDVATRSFVEDPAGIFDALAQP